MVLRAPANGGIKIILRKKKFENFRISQHMNMCVFVLRIPSYAHVCAWVNARKEINSKIWYVCR